MILDATIVGCSGSAGRIALAEKSLSRLFPGFLILSAPAAGPLSDVLWYYSFETPDDARDGTQG